jgi:hypothetical protein
MSYSMTMDGTRKPRRFRRGFFISVSIVAVGVELIRQLQRQKKSFVICELWSYPQIWGLDNFSPCEFSLVVVKG